MIVFWVTNRREHVPLGAMSADHIVNCILFLRSGQMVRPGCSGFSNREWELIFLTELKRRARLGAVTL